MAADTAVAVLVGGRSRRMGGRAKAALPLGGRTVLERVLHEADGLGCPVGLVAGREAAADGDELARLLERLGRPVVRDLHADAGPLGGLEAAFAATGAGRVLLLACDLPFLTLPFLSWLVSQDSGIQALVPSEEDDRCHPLCAVYPASCRGELRNRIEARRLRVHDFVRAIGARLLPRPQWQRFDADGRLLANLNEPADYRRAMRWLGETGE
ncbi:MAG: molybdenum cofactor guanylyltransferase [Gemmatimonadaceae bacterium]|nr:molybdenum cofactor guanylyltransferase [Gemmatimonadaceae bacterium]